MAVSFNEALAIAKEHWDEADYCTEYESAYSFSKMDDMKKPFLLESIKIVLKKITKKKVKCSFKFLRSIHNNYN